MLRRNRFVLRWAVLIPAWPLVGTLIGLRHLGRCPPWGERLLERLQLDGAAHVPRLGGARSVALPSGEAAAASDDSAEYAGPERRGPGRPWSQTGVVSKPPQSDTDLDLSDVPADSVAEYWREEVDRLEAAGIPRTVLLEGLRRAALSDQALRPPRQQTG